MRYDYEDVKISNPELFHQCRKQPITY